MKTITIQGQLRSESGKSVSRRLRSEGKVPAVIYGGKETIHFTTTQKELKSIVYTGDFMLAEIQIDGKSYKCILKDLQFHKLNDAVTHVDFLELVDDKKIRATVPLKFIGVSKGVKNGGRFVVKMSFIKVRTLPKNLKEFVEVDITNLTIGKNLRISDIKYDDAEILHNARIPIAAVATTRTLKQEGVTVQDEDEDEIVDAENPETEAEATAE